MDDLHTAHRYDAGPWVFRFFLFYLLEIEILSGSLQGDPRILNDFVPEIAEIFEYEDRLPAINDNEKAMEVPRAWGGGHKEMLSILAEADQ
jgi:hypothetical protein